MSALPRPRSTRDRAAPRRLPVLEIADGPAEFFGQIPAGPWLRKDLSDRAKVTLGGLAILARGSRTWVRASIGEVMAATGHSERKARQGLRELTGAGVIEWDGIGDRFRVLFRLRGPNESGPAPPSPRIAPDPAPPDAQACADLGAETVSISVPDPSPGGAPHTPVLERETRDDNDSGGRSSSFSLVSDGEPDPAVVAELVDRANALLTLGDATAGGVRAAVIDFSADWVRRAIEEIPRHNAEPTSKPVKTWGFVFRTLERFRHNGGPPPPRPATAPAAPPARRTPDAPDPAELAELAREHRLRVEWARLADADRQAIRAGVLADNPGLGRWPNMVETLCLAELEKRLAAPPEKPPAAGSHGNDPPPPAPEPIDDPSPPALYREQEFTVNATAERPRVAHQAPGGSNPGPPPPGGASPVEIETPPPGPAAGARPPGGAAGPADRSRFGGIAPPSGPESDDLRTARQRLFAPPPAPHRRE